MANRRRAGLLLAVTGFALAALGLRAAIGAGERRGAVAAGPSEERSATVKRVVDGDTLVVLLDGEEERVRLLGIDTPELARDERRGEYLAVEAAAAARELALDKAVLLSGDPQRKDRDEYGRLLRYVRLPDGRLLNAELLRRGLAHVFTRYPFARREEFLALAAEARERGLGLWAAGGVAEVEWNFEHGVRPVRLHPTTDWSWAIEYEGWIKTGVPSRDLVREVGRLRRGAESGEAGARDDRLREAGYVRFSRGER